ncbi:MAG: Zn-dependent alcohol dehydrogenase [Deltaproteobacteria bacterium]|nr:Zn-dependent alcohol dehydrogenase [Deltaproteobacteria bacterium]
MKAVLVEAPGQPVVLRDDVEIEEPRAGQVRVKVAHCGLCHSDLSIVDGVFPSAMPVVVGHEATGFVDALGPHVEGLAPGDPVLLTPCPPCGGCYWCVRGEASLCVNGLGLVTNTFPDGSTGLSRGGERVYRGLNVGAFAEYVVLPASGAVKIPADVPLDVACVIGCAVQTGVGGVLNAARVEEGASVLVIGLGGVGLSAVQGARVAGASRIIVSDPVAERRELAKTFGATDLLDPTQEDVMLRTRELTGVGVDYAFEAAGRGSLIRECVNATRNGGTTVCLGAPPIEENLDLGPASVFLIAGKRVVGSVLGDSNALREFPRLVQLWQAGQLDLEGLVTARRPIEEIDQALADLRASRGVRTVLSI